MDYDKLTIAYWEEQLARVRDVLDKIQERPQAAVAGRVVPQDTDLALGTGRALSLAVMFTDISKFSERPSGTHSEQDLLLKILNLHFTEMIRVAEEYGGTVEKNTGDGLMAYFEDDPGEHSEGACKRALAAALSMMYVNQNAINVILRQSSIQEIQFRIGIDYGPITIAQLGAARRFGGLVAIGATANIANKMLRDASPGDILIGEDVHKRLPEAWKQWSIVHNQNTGWIYVTRREPYWFYKYTGRWTRPI